MDLDRIKRIDINISGLLSILLTVLFVGLKLCGIITWAWIWVISPMWIGIAFWLIVIIICLVLLAILKQF